MINKLDLGLLQSLMDDPTVSEIMVNGPSRIFVEKNGKKMLSDIRFASEEEVLKLIERIYAVAGKRVAPDCPWGDVCMEDGTRVNAIIPPLARFGSSLTFRKFSKFINTLDDLIKIDTITRKAADFLIACVRGKVNIIFSGGTGVGKTTLLQMLSSYFAPEERIVTVEDAAELKLAQENIVSLETRAADINGKGEVTLRDLIRNAMRMTPDRIVVGEVRGGEAIDMLQAMSTGHGGTIGVVHGNSPKDVVSRLETMVLMSGVELPMWEVRKLVASTVNLVVHLQRMPDGSRKVTHITEIRGIDREDTVLNDLFVFDIEKTDQNGKVIGKLRSTIRHYPIFYQRFQRLGLIGENIFVND